MAKDFIAGLEACSLRMIQGAHLGMKRATLRFEDDTITKSPKAPLDYGTLRASTGAFLNGRPVGFSDHPIEPGGKYPKRLRMVTKLTPARIIEGKVVCNVPQAALLHAGLRMGKGGAVSVRNWGRTRMKRGMPPAQGTGAGWIKKKMDRYGRAYFKIIAQHIKAAKRA